MLWFVQTSPKIEGMELAGLEPATSWVRFRSGSFPLVATLRHGPTKRLASNRLDGDYSVTGCAFPSRTRPGATSIQPGKLPRVIRRQAAGLAAVLALACAALAACADGGRSPHASAVATPLPPADRIFVDRTVAEVMREARIPGLTISITGPRGNYSRSYGRGRIAPQVPMRATDHVRIASITKTFVATAILQQVDRGRLRLSHTIDRYVRGVPNGKKITIRELLAMRSGIYDFTADPTFHREFERNPLMRFRPLDIIPIIRRHQPLFPPNARTQYADTNYIL